MSDLGNFDKIYSDAYPKLMGFVMRWNTIFRNDSGYLDRHPESFCKAADELLADIEDKWRVEADALVQTIRERRDQ
jgi:hypothetical protein